MGLDGDRLTAGDKSCLLEKGKRPGDVRRRKEKYATPGGLEGASGVSYTLEREVESKYGGKNLVTFKRNSG